jgi:hypothetical protein
MLKFSNETYEFDLHEIQREAGPFNLGKVGTDEGHPKLALANIVKSAIWITAILSKQSIESFVKGLKRCFPFLAVHDSPNLVIFRSIGHSLWQLSRESGNVFNEEFNTRDSGHYRVSARWGNGGWFGQVKIDGAKSQ